jgi:hypothetical protein
MTILLGDFNVEVDKEDVFMQQLGMRVYTKSVMVME